ncbi:unnamed protein product [Linum tenue]|uniref:Uncharacterized protein n=1 Tax=Linum tenue TaxID=586396 RepID=A0AAV0MFW4_9ROSI|nr:unnamed protein product [Linum tenue]
MEVKIIETIPIRPSQHPFSQDHSLPLSRLDTDPNLDVTIRYVRVYVNNTSTTTTKPTTAKTHPFDVIADALSRALVHYYPLAAGLRSRNGRLEVFCSRDQLGLPLTNATVSATLASVNYLDEPGSEFTDRLAPNPSPDERLVHPFMLQVTTFECGGFALGAAVNHALCDGMGATMFFNAAAELARGADKISVEPVWDREGVFRPRDPPRVEEWVGEVLGRKEGMVGPGGDGDGVAGGKVVRSYCFDVRDEWVEGFKNALVQKCGSKFTTFEALGAFIWRAKVKASGISAHEFVKFVYAINVRKLVKPPLPAGYWGNGCVPMCVQLQAKDLLEQPIWRTAELIKQSKRHVAAPDGYVSSFIDFIELHGGEIVTAASSCRVTSGFTDWRHLGQMGVDFGWGNPVTVLPLSTRRLLGSDEPCFFLPHSSVGEGKGDGGFKVLVLLSEAAMPGFKIEIEKFCSQEFGQL